MCIDFKILIPRTKNKTKIKIESLYKELPPDMNKTTVGHFF